MDVNFTHRALECAALCAAVVVAAGCTSPRGAPEPPAAVCYQLDVGHWSSGTFGYTLPRIVQLDTVLLPPESYRPMPWRLAAPDIAPNTRGMRPHWIISAGDTLRMEWSTGFSGFELALGPERDDSRHGVATAFSDHMDRPRPRADVVARRSGCDGVR